MFTLNSSFSYLINDYSKLTSRLTTTDSSLAHWHHDSKGRGRGTQRRQRQRQRVHHPGHCPLSTGKRTRARTRTKSQTQTQTQTQTQRRGRGRGRGERERAHESRIIYYTAHRTLHTAHIATSESCHRLPSREALASGRSRDRRRAPNTTKHAAPGPARGSVQNFRTIT